MSSFSNLPTKLAAALFVIAPTVGLAQESCPEEYPVDCGTGSCCQAGTYCLPEGGCAPLGWSSCGDGMTCPPGTNIFCPGLQTCYATYEDAAADGCAFEATTVCGVPSN